MSDPKIPTIDDIIRSTGKGGKSEFQDLMKTFDWDFIEEVFETGFKDGVFNRNMNRNVLKWSSKKTGKTYYLMRFET